MAYVDPPVFVPDTACAASDLNILSADIAFMEAQILADAGCGVSLLRGTNVSCTTATWTTISWVSAPIDVGGWWTSGTDIVVPSGLVPAGYSAIAVEIQTAARFDANGTGTREIQVLQNGSAVEVPFSTSAITGDTTPVGATVWASCVAGDVLTIQVYQNSGGNLNCNHANAHVKRIFPIP